MQVDELQLRFKINERALLDGLIKSASTVSDEFADELSKKFEAAINKVTKRGQTVMQLGGLFVNLFNEFSEAAGDVDKLSSAMDNLVNRFEFLSNIEKKSGVKGLLNEFNVTNIDKLLDYYDKMYEAEEKIQKIREKNNRELIKQNAQKKVRSADDLLKMGRGEKDDSKDLRDYVKKYIDNAVKENEKLKPASAEDANKLLAVSRQYADLVSAYKKLLQEAPKKGSEEAVTQQLEIISILTELKKYEQQNVVLADFRKNIEKELPDDFKNIQKEASTIEVQGLTLAINNMVTALVKPLQTQIAKIYEEAIEKATGIAVKKGEDIMQTYEEAVKVFNLQEEKAPASKKRVGIAKKIPTQFGGVGSAGADNIEEEINEFAKYYKSLEDAKQHIVDLLNDRNVKATTVDSNNFEKIKDLIGYIQGYISLGGQIEDLNLDKTTLRRFNLQGMSTNYANQISAIKNTIIDAFKQVAANNYGTVGNAEVVNAAVANDVSTNPNANVTGGLSNEAAVKLVSELNVIKNEMIQYQEKIGTDIINKIDETNKLIEKGIVNNLSTISNNIIDLGNKLANINNLPQNINNSYGNIANMIADMMNADSIMKQNKIQLHERGMFYNSKTKQHTNEFIYGNEHSLEISMLNEMAKRILADSMMHSHTGKYANMSFVEGGEKADLFTFKKYKDKGINTQIIAAQDNIQIFDAKSFYDKYGDFFENVTQETLNSIEEQIKTEAKSIATTPDREQELVDILSQIKIPFESFITNYEDLPQEIKSEIETGDFQNRFIDILRNAKNNIWESIEDFEKVSGLEDFDLGGNLSNWMTSAENGMILVYQKAQENILKKFLNDDSFKMSDYSNVLSLDDFKEQYGDGETELSIIVDLLKDISSSLSDINLVGMKDEIETLKESVINLSSILPNNSDLSKTNTKSQISTGTTAKDFYEKYGTPKQALDKGYFEDYDTLLNELGGDFKKLDQSASNFESQLETTFLGELIPQLSLTEDKLLVIKKLLSETTDYDIGGKFRGWNGTEVDNDSFVANRQRLIKDILKDDYVITKEDIENARHYFQVINQSNETPVLTEPDEPINQDSSPALIKVKPVINPQEFADEVSEQLIGYNVQVNVAPKTEDQNLFVTEVSQSLNGWNVNVSVQPEINEPSKFAESVSEQIQFSPAQIPVEPLSEGQFDAEGFAQKVTNRLIGETAKIYVEIGEIKNGENINIDSLKGVIDSVQQQINSKDDAFVNEKEVVDSSIGAEITKLNELKDVIEGVTRSVNEKTKAFKNEAKTVKSVLSEESRSENSTNTKKKNKSSKNQQEEYDEEYAKVLSSAMSDADENLKREEEERRKINELRAEGIKQEQEFYKHQGENQKTLQKYSQQLFNLSKDSNLEKYPTIYRELLSNINDEIDRTNGLDIIKDEDLEDIKELFDGLNDINKLASGANISNYIVKLEKILEKNTKMSPETRAKFESYILQLKNNAELTKNEFRDIVEETNKVEANMIKAGEAGKGLLSAIKDKAFYRTAQYISTFFSFQDIIRYAKQAISTVRELDTALVDLRKTTTMSNAELNNFYYTSNAVAKQMGVTTEQIISQASAWSRLGYSTAEQAEKMSALSSQFASISPDMNVDTATDGLVSSMKAFGISVDDVERQIMDNVNRIGNTMATSNGEIVDMLTRSSAAMATANNTIQETIALESAAVEITRNAETTGTAFKTLSMRIRGYDEETEELSDDLQNIAGDIADLTKIDGKGGISLFTDETKETYKSTYQILKEISEIWDQISDKNQAALLEKLAGKRGGQVVAGVLSNFSAAEKAMHEMTNAAGSADAEMEIIQESIDYKLNVLKETWVGVAQSLIDRGTISRIVDGFTSISEAIGLVVDKAGLLGTLGAVGGAFLGFKNFGIFEPKKDKDGRISGIGLKISGKEDSVFSKLTDKDRDLLNEYNNGLRELDRNADVAAYSTGFLAKNTDQLSDNAKNLITNAKGGAIALDGYASKARVAAIATNLLNAAINTLIVVAATMIIKGIAKWWDDYNVTLKESKERVDDLKSSIKSLSDELQSLNSKEALTPEESARLTYLEKRIALEEKLLEIAERQKANKDLGNSKTTLFPGTLFETEIADKDSLEYKTKVEMGFSTDEWMNDTVKFFDELAAEINGKRASMVISEASMLVKAQEDLYETADRSGDLYANKSAENFKAADQAYDDLLSKYQEYSETIAQIQNELSNENLTSKQRKQYEEYLRIYENGLERITYYINKMGITFNPEWIISPDIEFDLSDVPVSEYKQKYDEYVQKLYKFLNYHNYDKERYYSIFGTKGSIDNNPLYNQYVTIAQSAAEKFGDYTEEYVNGAMTKTYDLSFIDKIASKLNIQTTEQLNLLQKAIEKSEKRNDIEREYANIVEQTTEILDYANKKDKSKYTGANYVDDAQAEIKQLGDVLRQLQDNTLDESALIDFYQDFPEFQNITIDLQEAIQTKLVGAIEELERVTGKKLSPELQSSLAELVYNATNANRTLNETFNQAKNSFETFNELKNKISKGEVIDSSVLSSIAGISDKLDTMVAGYYGGVVTIEDIYEELDNQRKQDFENYKETYVRKQNLDNQYYKNAITSNIELVNTYNQLYHTDLENYNNFEEAKLNTFNQAIKERATTLAKFFNLSQSQMANMLSRYYDYENNTYTAAYNQLLQDARSGGASAEHANMILAQVDAYIADYQAGYEQLKQFGMNADNLIDMSGFEKNLKSSASSYKELFDFFERRLEIINQSLEKLDASLEEVNGSMSKNILIAGKIGIVKEEIKNYSSALTMYQTKANAELAKLSTDLQDKIKNGAVNITQLIGENGEEVNKTLEEYKKWADKVNDCNRQLITLKETLRDLALDKFNNIAQDYSDQFDILGSSNDIIEKQIALFEEAGQIVGRAFYESQIEVAQRQKSVLEKERAALLNELSSSISNGLIQKGTDEWLEMSKKIQEVDSGILDVDQSVERLQNSLLELNDKVFDRLQNAFSDIGSQLSNIIGMISDIDVSDESGVWSAEGLTQLGAYAEQYELARYNVEKYQEQLDALNDAYSKELYSTTEYIDKLSDLSQKQWDAANSAEDAKKSMIELNKARVELIKQGIQKQIDAYKELIDKQKQALDQEKSIRDHEKEIAEKSKNINKLQNQLNLLANDDSAAANAKRVKLQQELNDAMEDLEETQYNHSIEAQKEALDKQMEDFQDARDKEIEELEEYLKDTNLVFKDSLEVVKLNTDIIANQITEIAKKHGVQISEAITNSWKSGEGAIASYGVALTAGTSNFVQQIQTIELYLTALQDEADFTADKLVDMLSAKSDNLLNEFNMAMDSENELIHATNLLNDVLIKTLEGGYDVSGIIGSLQAVSNKINETRDDLKKLKDEASNTNGSTQQYTKEQANSAINTIGNIISGVTNSIGSIYGNTSSSINDNYVRLPNGQLVNQDALSQRKVEIPTPDRLSPIDGAREKKKALDEAWELFAYDSYYNQDGSYSNKYEMLAREAQYSQGAGQLKARIDKAIKEYEDEVERIQNKYANYATGVHNLMKSQFAWTQEDGSELVLSPTRNAMFTKLNKGDTVLTKNQTDNLFKLSKINPDDVFGKFKFNGLVPKVEAPVLTIGNVLTVNGNIDDTNVEKMKAVAASAIDKAFKKFSSEIIKR